MATPFDLELLQNFSFIFPFLLVFAIVLALLEKTKLLGDGKTMLNSAVAIVVAFLVLLSDTAYKIINAMAPWFVLLIVFLVFLMLIFMMFGTKETDFASAAKDPVVMWSIIIVSLVIIISVASQVWYVEGQRLDPSINGSMEAEEDYVVYHNTKIKPLYHPKLLGLIFIFLVAAFSVRLLSGSMPNR